MRIVRASIRDVFPVHKLWLAFMADTDQPVGGREKDLAHWLPFFGSERSFCLVLMHGKAYVGMAWGMAPDPDEPRLELHGVFVKRGFRTKLRPVRTLVLALQDLARQTGAVALLSSVPENQLRRVTRKGFKVSLHVVEKTLTGGACGI